MMQDVSKLKIDKLNYPPSEELPEEYVAKSEISCIL